MRIHRSAFPLAALTLYALAFMAMTWPLVTVLSTRFITDGGDGPMFVWNIDHFVRAVRSGANPFVTDQILAPLRSSLVLHTLIPLVGLLGLLIPNPILTLNLALLTSFVLSGLGAYLLCYHYVKDRWLALLVGFIFAYCPYKLSHLFEHANLMLTASIPFFVLFYLRAVEFAPSARRPHIRSGAALCMALLLGLITLLSDYYATLYILLFVLLHLGYHGFRLQKIRFLTRRNLPWAAASIVAATGLVVVLKILGVPSQGKGAGIDLLALTLPSAWSRLYDLSIVPALQLNVFPDHNPIEHTVFPGFGLLLAAAALIIFSRKRPGGLTPSQDSRFLLFVTMAFLLLSMPLIQIAGHPVCALPTVIWHYIPFVNNFRIPARYILLILLFGGIYLSLIAKQQLFPRLTPVARPLIVIGLLLICTAEYIQKPYPTLGWSDMPPVYHALTRRPAGTLLEIPSGICSGQREIGREDRRQMLWQLAHRKKIAGGSISRIPAATYDFYTQSPFFNGIFTMLEDSSISPVPTPQPITAAILDSCDLRYVLIAPAYRTTRLARHLETMLRPFIVNDSLIDNYRLITLRPR
jgi:hypothetical protein